MVAKSIAKNLLFIHKPTDYCGRKPLPALSIIVARSSAVQASSSRWQEMRWAIVSGSPQSQSTDWASSR